MYEEITAQAEKVTEEIIGVSGIKKGQILVVGCSTSEICGDKIGTNSNLDVAKAAFKGIYEAACRKGIYVATQCCEHLNRAIIVEREAVPFAEIVNVVPQPKAGGSLSTTAYETFRDPVAVEEIKADAGIDIGGTLIGMHLKKVAVPVRLVNNHIGQAYVSAARTRPKFIGGQRAHYDDTLKKANQKTAASCEAAVSSFCIGNSFGILYTAKASKLARMRTLYSGKGKQEGIHEIFAYVRLASGHDLERRYFLSEGSGIHDTADLPYSSRRAGRRDSSGRRYF